MEEIKGIRFVNRGELSSLVNQENLERIELEVDDKYVHKYGFFGLGSSIEGLKNKIATRAKKFGASLVAISEKEILYTSDFPTITNIFTDVDFYR